MNQHIITGHIGKEPEIRHINDTHVCSFTLASSDFYKDKDGKPCETTDWHNIVYWGKNAETIAKLATKGTQILVEGKVKTRTWEKDGTKFYRTETIGNRFELFGKRNTENNQQTETQQQTQQSVDPMDGIPFPNNVDDLPF